MEEDQEGREEGKGERVGRKDGRREGRKRMERSWPRVTILTKHNLSFCDTNC